MKQLSVGLDSTLGNWRMLTLKVLAQGDTENPAVKFLDRKIRECPTGTDTEVISNEGQLLWFLQRLAVGVIPYADEWGNVTEYGDYEE